MALFHSLLKTSSLSQLNTELYLLLVVNWMGFGITTEANLISEGLSGMGWLR